MTDSKRAAAVRAIQQCIDIAGAGRDADWELARRAQRGLDALLGEPEREPPLRWEVDEHGGMAPCEDGVFVIWDDVAHLFGPPSTSASEPGRIEGYLNIDAWKHSHCEPVDLWAWDGAHSDPPPSGGGPYQKVVIIPGPAHASEGDEASDANAFTAGWNAHVSGRYHTASDAWRGWLRGEVRPAARQPTSTPASVPTVKQVTWATNVLRQHGLRDEHVDGGTLEGVAIDLLATPATSTPEDSDE